MRSAQFLACSAALAVGVLLCGGAYAADESAAPLSTADDSSQTGAAPSGGTAATPSPDAAASTSLSDFVDSGRLLLTQGVSNVEGASGGGLASWAVISGYETNDAVGGNAHFTYLNLPGYTVRDFGGSVGLFNRVELSYTRLQLDTGPTGGKLGIGDGYTFNEDIIGAKVRLFGDLVYDQNSLLPQVAVGVQYKHSENGALDEALGARNPDGVDFYVSATKLFLNNALVVDTTLRLTKANQIGLLGFGGDLNDTYRPEFEGSVGYLITRRLVIGGEYRTMPSNLGFAKADNWFDVFAAYALNKDLSITLAYANLGSIATFKNQDGVYVSVQAGF
ncbi:MAG: DUF3034 family protein [Alphaproteobacteria bacterium]|nr:DUF3034 family protein [Alphaproteobacteria bacterium]